MAKRKCSRSAVVPHPQTSFVVSRGFTRDDLAQKKLAAPKKPRLCSHPKRWRGERKHLLRTFPAFQMLWNLQYCIRHLIWEKERRISYFLNNKKIHSLTFTSIFMHHRLVSWSARSRTHYWSGVRAWRTLTQPKWHHSHIKPSNQGSIQEKKNGTSHRVWHWFICNTIMEFGLLKNHIRRLFLRRFFIKLIHS